MNTKRRRRPTGGPLRRLAGALAVVVCTATVGAGTAAASEATTRSLAVSVPSEPVVVTPGQSSAIPIRIVNPAAEPVIVTFTSRPIELGDNGSATIGEGPDERWSNRVSFLTEPTIVPAQGYVNVTLRVDVPPLEPDLYFIGFLVTPEATGTGQVHVINQIGSFVTVDVPGPRQRSLRAKIHLPSIRLGSQVQGALEVHNTGTAVVRFWGEDDATTSAFAGTTQHPLRGIAAQRLEPAVLPVARTRSFAITGRSRWPIGYVSVAIRLTFPDQTEVATTDVIVTKRVLVVSVWVPVVLGGLVLAALAWVLVRRRRRKPGTDENATAPDDNGGLGFGAESTDASERETSVADEPESKQRETVSAQ